MHRIFYSVYLCFKRIVLQHLYHGVLTEVKRLKHLRISQKVSDPMTFGADPLGMGQVLKIHAYE